MRKSLQIERDEHARFKNTSEFIRPLLEVIAEADADATAGKNVNGLLHADTSEPPRCLIFPWIEQTLEEIDWKKHRKNYRLLSAIVTGSLKGLAVLEANGRVHGGMVSDSRRRDLY